MLFLVNRKVLAVIRGCFETGRAKMDYCKNAVEFTCSPFGKKNQGQSSISCLTGHPQPLGMFESGGPLAHSLACRRHLETDIAISECRV